MVHVRITVLVYQSASLTTTCSFVHPQAPWWEWTCFLWGVWGCDERISGNHIFGTKQRSSVSKRAKEESTHSKHLSYNLHPCYTYLVAVPGLSFEGCCLLFKHKSLTVMSKVINNLATRRNPLCPQRQVVSKKGALKQNHVAAIMFPFLCCSNLLNVYWIWWLLDFQWMSIVGEKQTQSARRCSTGKRSSSGSGSRCRSRSLFLTRPFMAKGKYLGKIKINEYNWNLYTSWGRKSTN